MTISWQAPTQRSDGTALASSELASFEVLYFDDATGTMRTVSITNPAQRSVSLNNLRRDTTHHFSITATDTGGRSSAASDTIEVDL